MIRSRKQEAEKSLVIQVNSENSYQELFNYCSQFGEIKSAFHYKIPEGENHFILLEYQDKAGCADALRDCRFNDETPGVPVTSPFVWFKAAKNKKAAAKAEVLPPALRCEDTRLIEDIHLNDMLRSAVSLDDQMLILYRQTCLSDLGTRTRFLAAKQLETAFKGIFPNVQAYPFGSSVNGFGKTGCDLDLVLCVQDERLSVSDSRLIFHTKTNLSNVRSQTQRQMEVVGDILHLFLPGVTNVRRILQASVPIIKFNHECLHLDVDLSMSNLTGLYMSELLYLYGEIDERVRPLTSCIRKWARVTGLTNASPGRWISNFSLTCLVVFFLQNLNKPILPSLKHLIKSARKEDVRIADNNINCTFLRDLKDLKFQRENDDSLSYLLIQFFEFYSLFDFGNCSISLVEGDSSTKPDHSAVWIVNPFEPLTNVSKNISLEELERFKFEVKNAAWILEADDKKNEPYWGLLSLFKTNKEAIVKPQMFYKSRLVDVSELFTEKDEAKANLKFRNNSTWNEVKAIRHATKKLVQNIKVSNMKYKRR